MSSYQIKGVKITPAAGGYYDLEHSSLDEPERVRGKEKADQRAEEIAKAAEQPEGSMQQQGDLTQGVGGDVIQPGDDRSAAERTQERNFEGMGKLDPNLEGKTPTDSAAQIKANKEAESRGVIDGLVDHTLPTIPGANASEDQKGDEIAALKAQLAEANKRAETLEKAAQPVVQTVLAADPELAAVPRTIPREYTGQMDAKTKAALKKAGVGVSTIILEENDSIPPTGLFIGHNGKSYMIAPGEEVDVPDFLISVLDDAVTAAPIVDSKSQKVLGYRNRSKYPYRRIT